jgi:hypothetical protein
MKEIGAKYVCETLVTGGGLVGAGNVITALCNSLMRYKFGNELVSKIK